MDRSPSPAVGLHSCCCGDAGAPAVRLARAVWRAAGGVSRCGGAPSSTCPGWLPCLLLASRAI
eukprot:2487411-Prymnesium_polylepis.1